MEENELAYEMAQIPKAKPLPSYYDNPLGLNASKKKPGEVRTL
jgi:hypothetical protein